MSNAINLSEKWVKASIIGTIWAASEIVLGSFLHNLKIPFSGNILTSIALIFIISVSYIWKEKGLYWRAGVICAIMKTMSPSAVIFGPMVAIISEALLLEFSVRLLGRTILGFIIGAMLAMSWNLFQKIINYIIFYGFNIIDVYTNLLSYAQKQFNVHFDLVWTPVLALLFIYCALGLVSAIIGIRVGRKVLKQSGSSNVLVLANKNSEFTNKPKHEFSYSLLWLLLNIVFITISLFLLNYTSWFYWSIAIIGIALIWVYRYKRVLRQLSKPRFWISFVLITMITAFVFSKIQANSLADGLLVGVKMNFRAIIIILGFTVLGTELYNPVIRNFFLKTWFKQLPLALELSFKSLPSMIASTPDFKSIVKSPISVIYQVISQAESRLAELKSNLAQKVFIISGAIGQGKTVLIQQIEKELQSKSITVGGILSVRVVENEVTIGYDIVDILNRKSEVFLRITNDESLEKLGRFRIFPNGLEFGVKALNSAEASLCKIIIIDEVGSLELENKGWANSITNILNTSSSHLIISVRDTAVEEVVEKWKFRNYTIFKTSESDYLAVSSKIIEEISTQ